MSKPLAPGQTLVHLEPAQQVRLFADLYRDVANPAVYTRLAARVRQLDLGFSDDELLVLAAPRAAKGHGALSRLYPLIQALKSQWIQVDAQGHLDLQENAEDLAYFLESGFRIEQLLIQSR